MINIFDPEIKKIYFEETEKLLQEPDPVVFRKNARDLLNIFARSIEFAATSSSNTSSKIFDAFHPVAQKISEIALADRFGIIAFEIDARGHRIPLLRIIPEDGNKQFIRCPIPDTPSFRIRVKADADYLTHLLSTSAMPANAVEGCDAKAELSCLFLKSMGIKESSIKKVVVEGSFLQLRELPQYSIRWKWHTAPLVITENGERYVLDPFFNKSQALSVDDWKSLTTSDHPNKTYAKVIDSKHTYNTMKKTTELVTPADLENKIKRLSFYDFTTSVKQGGVLDRIICENIPTLEPLSESLDNKKSAVCRIS
jgi:hypothetical protein